MEIMSLDESLWEDHHHRYSFIPNVDLVDSDFVSLISSNIVKHPQTPVLLQGSDSKGNLYNITQTIPIDISVKPGVVEHVHIGQNCSTTEIFRIPSTFQRILGCFFLELRDQDLPDGKIS